MGLFDLDLKRGDLISPSGGVGSVTDNAIARWDGTSGLYLQNSGWLLDDTDNMLVPTISKLNFRDTGIGIYSQADSYLDIFADGYVRIGNSSGGAPTTYFRIDPDGSWRGEGATALFYVCSDDYAFKYCGTAKVGVAKDDFGLYFQTTGGSEFQFVEGSGTAIFKVNANNGNLTVGSTGTSSVTCGALNASNANIGDIVGGNYTQINSNGSIQIKGTGVIYAYGNDYVFKYLGQNKSTAKDGYGVYFSVSSLQYQFLTNGGGNLFNIGVNSGDVTTIGAYYTNNNKGVYHGNSNNVRSYYDGTAFWTLTDLVAASDWNIDCGTNKTIELQQSVWEDIQFGISSGKVGVTNVPRWTTFTTNTSEYAFDVDDYIDLNSEELNHKWVEGTTGNFHIHIALEAAQNSGANRYAQFTLYVSYQNTSSIWTETSFTAEQTIPNGAVVLQSYYLDLGDLAFTNLTIGTQVKVRIKRIAATGGTEYASGVFINQVGCHVQQNTLGSRQETSK